MEMKRLLALLITLALAACTTVADETTTTGVAASTTEVELTTTTVPQTTTTATARSGVQAEIDWFVDVLNGQEISSEDYETRFSDSFREQVPFSPDFEAVLDQLRPGAPYVVEERSGETTSGQAIIRTTDGQRLRVIAGIQDDGRFETLLVQPAEPPELEDPPASIGDAFDELAELGELRALTAEITGDECAPVTSTQAGDPAPIGSIFKLYVLAALGEAIDGNELAWEDQIEIQDSLKSIPTGVLQDRPAGSMVTIKEAAQLMISISDNTAADHLIDLLGRSTIESTLAGYGNTTPELDTPFLTTREFAALKVGPASGLATQWLDADVEARRQILDQVSGITPGDLPIQDWTKPVMPDEIEWFATPTDLCELAIRLAELADRVPEIAEILQINPGVPGADTWDRIWFKGGSEPGLLAMWFRTEIDDRVFFTAGSVVNPDSTFDQTRAALLFGAARDLLAP